MSTNVPLWSELAAAAGVGLDESKQRRLEQYLDLLEQANQRMNLTRITDRDAARVQHLGDALTLLPFLPAEKFRLADVGSGGGVPGIPLAIVRPDARVFLIESTKKKAAFLRECVLALELGNVSVLDERAEDVGRSSRRESFDVVVARAVAELVWLAEWCLPLVKVGGAMLAMKGERAAGELAAATAAGRVLGGATPVVHPVALPGTQHHVVVEIRKVRPSGREYPRAATTAKGKALR